jgi:glycosyltransferase involved in cell wall biosynthesis
MTCHGIQSDLYADMDLLRDSIDAVICTNRLACALAVRIANWPAARVLYAPYGTELHEPASATDQTVLRLAYSGRLEESQKRIRDLAQIVFHLEAAEIPFRLRIAGDGPDEEVLRQQLAGSIAQGTVEFLGRMPADRLSEQVYRWADVLLLTSRWETGPIVVWEAMAHGVTVVSSRYIGSGQEAALRHGENALLFDVGDPQGAADLVRKCHANRESAARLARAGRELIRQRYTIDASVGTWAEALEAVLGQPLRPLRPLPNGPPAGRLDPILGEGRGETLRRLLRRTGPDRGPGGEWPHRLSQGRLDDTDDTSFWQIAAELDGVRDIPVSSAELCV